MYTHIKDCAFFMLKSKVCDCVFNSTAGTVGRKVILMRIKIISSDYSQNGKPKSLIDARLDRQTLFLAILWNRLGRQRLNHQQSWRTLHTICNYSSQNLLFHQHSKLKYVIFQYSNTCHVSQLCHCAVWKSLLRAVCSSSCDNLPTSSCAAFLHRRELQRFLLQVEGSCNLLFWFTFNLFWKISLLWLELLSSSIVLLDSHSQQNQSNNVPFGFRLFIWWTV